MVRDSGMATLIAATLAVVPCGWAQSNPSADQLIDALKPTAHSVNGPTRGIRPIGPQSEPTAAPASATARPRQHTATAAPGAVADTHSPSVSLYVPFASGSADLTPQAMASLDELGKALSSSTLSAYRFRIEGHTDTVGSKTYNQLLSERRAAAVAAYIERKFGLSEDRLVSVGFGSQHPIVPTPDQTPEARNRRVQVINLGV